MGSNHWKKKKAQQWIFGVNYTTIYQRLLNWSFLGYDSEERRYYPTLSYWTKEGKATAVTRQGTIMPEHGYMARLTTKGRGQYGYSVLYQSFLVPRDADFLEFDYQMLTTERQKGDYGNDFLRIDLVDQYDNLLESLAYESVNSTTWYWSQTTGFEGDNWVGVSHWKHVLCTRMWRYRGQVVTLRVYLRDNGNPKAYSGALFSCVWLE